MSFAGVLKLPVTLVVGGALLLGVMGVVARGQEAAPGKRDLTEAVIKEGWQPASLRARLWMQQDRTQRECTHYGNNPPDRDAVAITEREWNSIVFPADGKLLGDWRRGEMIARTSPVGKTDAAVGGQVAAPLPMVGSGQCIACHQLDARDLGDAKSGPSLIGYGARRALSEARPKLLYEQIFNSNAVVACSAMPRFGAHQVLTPEDVRDIVAYLLVPQSPVNLSGATPAPSQP